MWASSLGGRERKLLTGGHVSNWYSQGTCYWKALQRRRKNTQIKTRSFIKQKWRPLGFPTFGVGIFCWTSAQHLPHTRANDRRCQYFSPHFAHTWENSTCTTAAGAVGSCSGAVGSCSSANTQSRGEEAPQAGSCSRRGSEPAAKPHVRQPLWGRSSARVPASPVPILLGGAEVPLAPCRRHPRAKSKRAQGDLLASSAGGQVELSLTPYSHHLCLSLQINTITLNPQAEQRELFLFKGNVKSL